MVSHLLNAIIIIVLQNLKNFYHLIQALLANIIYGFPGKKLYVIGVTGTDGKTTTTSLIHHILKESGKKAGMISTLGAKVNNQEHPVGLHTTTPTPFLIQKLLNAMVKNGCRYAVLEVTSHAIDQNRIWGIPFRLGVLTNITHEHLDYHHTFNNYMETKTRFLKSCSKVVLNVDDKSSTAVSTLLLKSVITYSVENKSDYQASKIILTGNYQSFNINNLQIRTCLLGTHNLYNNLAAIAVSRELGILESDIKSAVENFSSLPGRLETIIEKPFKIFVDFAHTPNAFQNILPTVKTLTMGKLIHVFGATGKRDATKRPKMGEISGRLADICIVTSEDTYGEEPDKIISDVEKGLKKTPKILNKTYFIIPDRYNAIKKAISLANDNDTILLTGVGHQTSLNLGNRELPWNEKEMVLKILSKK